ncbi:hypothetical protein Pelo_7850 [Pelomyxa schiedti]|nr:hypothetical protein Pelo_7850 [Pelomyxa schiedti]
MPRTLSRQCLIKPRLILQRWIAHTTYWNSEDLPCTRRRTHATTAVLHIPTLNLPNLLEDSFLLYKMGTGLSQEDTVREEQAVERGDMPELPSPTWDINTPIEGGDWTMLHIACSSGHVSLVVQLLGVGASRSPPIDPNKTNFCGETPLLWAAFRGHEAVVRVLVARSDVDVAKGCPLIAACRHGHLGVVMALLECPRVDVNLVEKRRGYQDEVLKAHLTTTTTTATATATTTHSNNHGRNGLNHHHDQ